MSTDRTGSKKVSDNSKPNTSVKRDFNVGTPSEHASEPGTPGMRLTQIPDPIALSSRKKNSPSPNKESLKLLAVSYAPVSKKKSFDKNIA